MDRSLRRLPDPLTTGERRHCVRQKLHTPVYASFNGPQTGLVVDLSELLDLHEDGFAVQTSERLEVNRAVTVCLDLPETKSFIHGTGRVAWSDDSGRGGIQLSELPESSRRILKEWLFANLLIACSNRAARAEQRARREEELRQSMAAAPLPVAPENVIPIQQASDPGAALDAIRREVENQGSDIDAVLQVITRHALALTRASGVALALLTEHQMICRAQAGAPAPPIGTSVDVTQGLSGECVRSGSLVSCEDMQNDPRVDPDLGRALGIGSLLAAPIMSAEGTIGLLEVLSPRAHNFSKTDETFLTTLAEMVSLPVVITPSQADPIEVVSIKVLDEALWEHEPETYEPNHAAAASPPAVEPMVNSTFEQTSEPSSEPKFQPVVTDETPEETPEEFAEPADTAASRLPATLLGVAFLVVALAIGYLIGPIVERRFASSFHAVAGSSSSDYPSASPLNSARGSDKDNSPSQPSNSTRPKSLTEVQALADRGDADAEWQMGVRYHNGDGLLQSDQQAMLWFQLAAEQGNVSAQSALGSYYWAGRGVPEDLSKAYMWSAIAVAHGDEISKSRLEGLAARMTREQVSAATDQADVWLRAHTQRAKSEAN